MENIIGNNAVTTNVITEIIKRIYAKEFQKK